MEPKEKKVSIGLLWAIIAIPVFEILRVPLGIFFGVIGLVANAVLVNPFMWFMDRGIIGAFWSYQIPILPYAVAIIFKVIAIPVVFIVLLLALIIGFIILVLSLLFIWLGEIHILAWIIAPIFAYYAYMTDFWAEQREDIRDRLEQIRAVLVNIVSWFASFRAIKIKLAGGKTVSYKIKRKYSKTVLALAVVFISIGMIGRSTEFFFVQRRNHTLSYKSSSYLYVDADALNVRTQPNSTNSSSIIAVVKKGQSLEKLGEQDHWYKVRLSDDKIGWVYGEYVSDTRIISESEKFAPEKEQLINLALGKPVSVTTNGVEDSLSYAGNSPSDITDGSLDYKPASEGVEDGCVGWNNDDYNETMIITVTIDLQGTYNISKIRYNPGNCQRAETWNADIMESPFGRTPTNPGSLYQGAWTEQTGNITASKVTIKLEKTRRSHDTSWLFIGEIEVIGVLIIKSDEQKIQKTLSGLKGEYFNLSQFYGKPSKFPEKPNLSRIDKTIDFNWEWGKPDPAISSDYFGIRWTDFIYISTSGIYKFKVWRDDGCRLWFDNKLIFDTWYEGDWDHWIDFEHHFGKTGWHPFKLEFYEIADRARITLKWQPPGKDSFEVIPSSYLGIATEEIDSVVITMNGREEKGIPTGIILEPGQTGKISYISGKIISNTKTGFSVPIWGVPIEKTDSSWIPLMPYAKKGIWTNAVVVLLGTVGTELVYPFQKDNHEVVVKNTTSNSLEIRLFFHDAPGYFQDNDGDVKFLVEKLPTVMARVSNVDDKAIMYINDQEAITVAWGSGSGEKSIGHKPGDSGWINITPYLKMGDNIFRLWVWNAAGCCSASGAFEVQKNGIPILTRSFKEEDSTSGVKYDETEVLSFP